MPISKILLWSGFVTMLATDPGTAYSSKIEVALLNLQPLVPQLENSLSHTNSLKGIAVRLYQLGIEMRPLFTRNTLWVYPVYASIGGSFGYWLQGVERRQVGYLSERREALLEKRRRRAEREGNGAES